MKSLILALIVFVSSVNFSLANNTPAKKTWIEGKVVTIDLTKYATDNVEISIYDMEGNQIHSEKLNTANHPKRSYNLKELPVGNYNIMLNTAQRVITKNIEIEKSSINILDENVTFKPMVQVKENRWNVNLLAQNKETNITIYNNDEVLHTETIKGEMGIYKSYDLKNLESGKYFISIEVDNHTYTESLVK